MADDILPVLKLSPYLLDKASKYYRFHFAESTYERLKDWDCFSNPSLELHECNSRALLAGGRKCLSCNHNVDRACEISCDLQTFCLAAYAYRLGIGGKDRDKSFQKNLYKLTPDELYDKVMLRLSCGNVPEEVPEEVSEEVAEEEITVPEEVPESEEDIMAKAKKGDELKAKIESGELLYIKEAAEYKGCLYVNIYQNIKTGKIKAEMDANGKAVVSKEELDKFVLVKRAPRKGKE